jgi:hypothetical protein
MTWLAGIGFVVFIVAGIYLKMFFKDRKTND